MGRSARLFVRGIRVRVGVVVGLVALLCGVLVAPVPAMAAYRQTYQFLNKWAVPTPWPSAGFQPYGMALAPNGDVLIAGHDNYVAEYTSTGTFVTTLGSDLSDLWSSGGFSQVDNVAVLDENSVWVLDANRGVAKLRTDGSWADVSFSGHSGAPFNLPLGMAVDASGCVYVGDGGSVISPDGFRVSKFSPGGVVITTFGDRGTVQANRLWSAPSIAVGPDFQVYVADSQAGRVRRFTPNAARTDYTLTASWVSALFDSPQAVATDAAGNVFIFDYSSQTVTKMDPGGSAVARWGGEGTSKGLFANGWSLVVAPNHNVFVDDRDDVSVQEFLLPDLRPTTLASANVTVKKGKNASLKYKAGADVSPAVTVTIKVYKGSKLKATIKCGRVAQGVWHTKSWKCKLAKGSYTWKVYAVDSAGHAQKSVAAKTLKVK